MLFFTSAGSAAAGHGTHGGARETFISGGVDERTHGLARVQTEPARWFFFTPSPRDRPVDARAPRYGRRWRVRGRPRGQWAVAWAWPAARPDTIPAGVAVNLPNGRSGGGGGPVVCFRFVSAGRKTDGRNS